MLDRHQLGVGAGGGIGRQGDNPMFEARFRRGTRSAYATIAGKDGFEAKKRRQEKLNREAGTSIKDLCVMEGTDWNARRGNSSARIRRRYA